MLKKSTLFIGICLTSLSMIAQQIPFRAGPCLPGASPCSCMQSNSFVQLATAKHGAPVHAVSWCCLPIANSTPAPLPFTLP